MSLMQLLLATPSAQGIVTSGLVMHLDAGNAASYPGSGTAWTDLSGNGNNGTLTNGPTFSAADGGQIVFDGVNDYVVTTLTQPSVTQWSIEVWFKSTTTALSMIYQNRGNPTVGFSGVGLYLALNDNTTPTGTLSFGLNSNFLNQAIRTTATNINDGVWRQAVGVFSQASGTAITTSSFSLYINGVLASVTAGFNFNSTTSPIAGLGGAEIARIDLSFFGGNVAINRVYNRALLASEVAQNFNANRGRFGL